MCGAATGLAVGQVVEPPPLPEAPAEATPYEPFLGAGEKLPPRELLVQMNGLFDDIKKQYKLRNYTKMKKRTRDLRNMAQNLKRKYRETPEPTAFYNAADQLRRWTVKLRTATEALDGSEMYTALRRVAHRFNGCYSALGEPKKVDAGPRHDPPSMMIKRSSRHHRMGSDVEEEEEEAPEEEGRRNLRHERIRPHAHRIPTPGADDITDRDLDDF